MIRKVLVLGAGSAGLLAALSLKRKIPHLEVRIVRSPEIGVIGVGEGTTPNFPKHLFDYLGLSRKLFYERAQPVWKLGIRFLWGPRERFDYGFGQALDARWLDLPRPNGYYCDETLRCCDLPTALMTYDKAFARRADGIGPDVHDWHAFHIENHKLVETLEFLARGLGIEIIDGRVAQVEHRAEGGLSALGLADGRRLEADLFVDASGFRSELLGGALQEPFVSYSDSLFCDRAVLGGWERTDEPILPYTTAETMDGGWAWQIEHEHHVNRGYVYSSAHVSDDEARTEFLRKNPKAPRNGRIVKFRSGRYRRSWVENVVAIGNAAGFVEPLEATALMVVCAESQNLVESLLHTGLSATPSMRRLYNDTAADTWDEIRDFLALHYKLNTRLDTPFWRHCRAETDVSDLSDLLEFYEENGPTGFARHRLRHGTGINFGIEGWLVMLVGNRALYRGQHVINAKEKSIWGRHCGDFATHAQAGYSIKEALEFIRHPNWKWK